MKKLITAALLLGLLGSSRTHSDSTIPTAYPVKFENATTVYTNSGTEGSIVESGVLFGDPAGEGYVIMSQGNKMYKSIGNCAQQLVDSLQSMVSLMSTDPTSAMQKQETATQQYETDSANNPVFAYTIDPESPYSQNGEAVYEIIKSGIDQTNFNAAFAMTAAGEDQTAFATYATKDGGYIDSLSATKGGPLHGSLVLGDATITYSRYYPLNGTNLSADTTTFKNDLQNYVTIDLTDDNNNTIHYNPLQTIAHSDNNQYFIGTTELTSKLSNPETSGYSYLGSYNYLNTNDTTDPKNNTTYFVYGQASNQSDYNAQSDNLAYDTSGDTIHL